MKTSIWYEIGFVANGQRVRLCAVTTDGRWLHGQPAMRFPCPGECYREIGRRAQSVANPSKVNFTDVTIIKCLSGEEVLR